MKRVLLIEDDPNARGYLQTILSSEGFETMALESGDGVTESLSSFQPDIVLLDYKFPKGIDGVQILKKVRDMQGELPVIMVTGVVEEEEKVKALELGADDYVVKPFKPRELTARIRAVLRRSADSKDSPQNIESDGLKIDIKAHRVTLQGNEIYLTLTEFRILCELLKQKGQVLSRDQLRQTALGNLNVTDRTIDVHVAALRKKLESLAAHIQTVRGVGYRYSH